MRREEPSARRAPPHDKVNAEQNHEDRAEYEAPKGPVGGEAQRA